MDGQPDRPVGRRIVFFRFVGHHDNFCYAFGGHLTGNHIHRQIALVMLPACHGHGIIEQDFIGHVGFGRHRKADRQQAGMVIGAVAQILEDMGAVREG